MIYDSGFHQISDPLAAAKALLQAISKRHHENQFMFGTTDIVLCGSDPLDAVKAVSEELLLLNKVEIPTAHTTVMCHGFTIEGSGHIIAMLPKITEGSPVHHFHLHRCRDNAYFRKYKDKPQGCHPPSFEKTQLQSRCIGSAYTYVAGQSGPFILPQDVGIVVGDAVDEGDIRHMILEIHYDNPTHIEGLHDESGIQLWRAHGARKYAASSMILGDPFAELYQKDNDLQKDRSKWKGIPPHKHKYEIQGMCSGVHAELERADYDLCERDALSPDRAHDVDRHHARRPEARAAPSRRVLLSQQAAVRSSPPARPAG